MRLVEGGDLKKRIAARGRCRRREAIDLLAQVADALDAAHAPGSSTATSSPTTSCSKGDHAYLSDFGLAKALGDSGVRSGASIVGTVEYMSPEQWRGEKRRPRRRRLLARLRPLRGADRGRPLRAPRGRHRARAAGGPRRGDRARGRRRTPPSATRPPAS